MNGQRKIHDLNYTDVWDVKVAAICFKMLLLVVDLSAPSLKLDTKNTTTCWVPFHDSMPSFMNFRRVLDLLEFKNKVSQHFDGNQRCPSV